MNTVIEKVGAQSTPAVLSFDSPEQLLQAVHDARKRGITKMEAYTPFPIHGLDEAMGTGKSRLSWIAFVAGSIGTVAAFLLQWWTGTTAYPLVIGGKPLFALEFSIPIMFELTVLFAAFGTVFGMLALNGLPRLHHPVFELEGFRGATDDRFLLVIEESAK